VSAVTRSEPSHRLSDPQELLVGQLDYYRTTLLHKLDGLSEQELRTSRLPSGWTPLELLHHLTHVEQRWLCWGFAAEQVEQPWGDDGPDGRWQVPEGLTSSELREEFAAQCARSRVVAAGAALEDRAALGGRFPAAADAPTLGWILLHLLQEYARHVGQLDIVRELADGAVGE
jgi:hypothetical protein